jgi:hypothetical protein
MPIGNWNLQWLNHNSQRSYPLTERATKTDITGTIRIPDSFIVALYLPIHSGLNVQIDQFYIQTLLLAPTGYTIGVGYSDPVSGTEILVATASIAVATHAPNTTYALGGINDFADSIGQIVIGRLDEINLLPQGLYTFNFAGAEIETDSIRPMIRGISAVRVINGAEISENIYGDIELVAGTNMRIDFIVDAGIRPQIIFNALSNTNLNNECNCNVPDTGECIRCINGICSDDGNFNFVGSDCISVAATSNGIKIEDTCALPCCGCAELDAIKTQIDRFSDGAATLQNFVSRLGSEVTQMSLVVLGSRLGDAGCNTCG